MRKHRTEEEVRLEIEGSLAVLALEVIEYALFTTLIAGILGMRLISYF